MADANNQKMLLVVNPVSGKKMAKQYMMRMINRFDQAGYNVTACCTQIDKNAFDIVLNRGAEFDIIVCCGGDGQAEGQRGRDNDSGEPGAPALRGTGCGVAHGVDPCGFAVVYPGVRGGRVVPGGSPPPGCACRRPPVPDVARRCMVCSVVLAVGLWGPLVVFKFKLNLRLQRRARRGEWENPGR